MRGKTKPISPLVQTTAPGMGLLTCQQQEQGTDPKQDDQDTGDAVDEPEVFCRETGADGGHRTTEDDPPENRPGEDSKDEFGRSQKRGPADHDTKAREDDDEEEDGQRVGKRDGEHREVIPKVGFVLPVFSGFFWHREEDLCPDTDEHKAGHHAEEDLLGEDESRHHGQAKNGNCCIERICRCNSEPGDDAVQPAVRNRPPDTEQGDGTHRYSEGEADDESLDERAELHETAPLINYLSFRYNGIVLTNGGFSASWQPSYASSV